MNSSSQRPLVSVVMSSRNGSQYIRYALDSMEAQSYDNWEWVLVDDGSDDDTYSIMNSYNERHPGKVRVLRNKNSIGQTKSLNLAIEQCRGDWIARMDDDDVANIKRLEQQVHAVLRNPAITLLGTNGYVVDESTGRVRIYGPRYNPVSIRIVMCWCNPFMHSSVMFKRCHLNGELVQYRDDCSDTVQDYDLWTRLTLEGRVEILEECLMTYRLRRTSLTGLYRNDQVLFTSQIGCQYSISLLKGSSLDGTTPGDVRSWYDYDGVPDEAVCKNIKAIMEIAARPDFIGPYEKQRAWMEWAASRLDAVSWRNVLRGDARRLWLGGGLREAIRYAAVRISKAKD